MPSANDLLPDQRKRRSIIIDTLTGAGWASDTTLWDAGISTSWVAQLTLRGSGTAISCNYVIVDGGQLPEFLEVNFILPEGELRLVVDFLGLTGGDRADRLSDVLAGLVWGQQQAPDEVPPAMMAALMHTSSVFTLDAHNRLVPFGDDTPDPGEQEAPASPFDSARNEDQGIDDVRYADPVEDRLHRELIPAGWRRTPDDAVLMDLAESFFVENGPVRLSVGRCNRDETRVRISSDDQYALLNVAGLERPEDADRLIGVLRRWQGHITADALREFTDELVADYPKVYFSDEDDDWVRIGTARGPAAPPPGAQTRTRMVGDRLGRAGWTAVAGPPVSALSMGARNRYGATLRCDHALNGFRAIPEALVLDIALGDGDSPDFGPHPVLVLDVLDLRSGRGDRGALPMALDVIDRHRDAVAAGTLGNLVRALTLCCPVFLLRDDGEPRAISISVTDRNEPPTPMPRALAHLDKLIADRPDAGADLWFERGLAARAEDRPDLALADLQEAIRRDPRHGPAHYQRGLIIGASYPDEADRSLRECVRLGYAAGPALLLLASLLWRSARRDEALAVLTELTTTLPEYGPGWYERALDAVKLGRHEESIAAAAQAIRLMPDHADAFYTRACAYALTGRADAALADIERTLDLNPSLRDEILDDDDFAALRADDRFTKLVDPWPEPGEEARVMDSRLADVLRRAGWRPDPHGGFMGLEYPCRAGRLLAGDPCVPGMEIYVNLRPYGAGEAGEGWLYTPPDNDLAVLGEILVAWQDRLTGENFAEFAAQVEGRLPGTTWHRGHP
ncbi:tetratricopeptide repeat protein [Actinomadura sp. B10D3]|uniref:tetratricopeptide repeat protein n=1 Tax=Actinomadura sp. B10D3 TaxID=3153557 RepID=UPI00325CF85A